MAACTPSIHVFLGRPLFLLSSGTHSIINFGMYKKKANWKFSISPYNIWLRIVTWNKYDWHTNWSATLRVYLLVVRVRDESVTMILLGLSVCGSFTYLLIYAKLGFMCNLSYYRCGNLFFLEQSLCFLVIKIFLLLQNTIFLSYYHDISRLHAPTTCSKHVSTTRIIPS